jgi:gliding motility-associated-like protein
VDVITTDSGCDDDAGSITIVATGTDLVYSIDGGANFSTDNVFEGLAAGTYTILIMDANGEMSGTTATVAATEVPVIVAVETSQPDCAGGLGSMAVTATGTDLLYSMDGGATFQGNGFFLDLEAGTYDLVVINAAGCTATQTVELVVVGAPVINSVEVVAPVCAGDANGSISVVASGTPAFTYSIDGGATFQADALFSNVPAGTYTLVVEDADGCSTSQEVVVADPPLVQADLVTVLSENCSGLCDGTIYVVSFAATTYALDDGPTQEEGLWVALCPGTYTVFLANDNGCTADTTVVIGDGAVVVAGFTADPLEPTSGTSIAFTNTSEGAATYIWDFGGLDISLEEEPFFNFPEGMATLEVCLTATDTAGCFDVYCEVITASPEVEFTVPNIFSPNGDGVNDIFGVTGNPGALSSFSLEVFNRFGQLLFSGDRIGMAWDGRTFAGEPASEGTYFWVLRFQVSGSAAEERSGHLTLVR